METTGKVIAILPKQSGVSKSGKEWSSQQYVLEIPDKYTRKMVFSVFGEENIKNFNIQMNEEIKVKFDIDAHEYKDRWYNEVRAYNIGRNIQPAPQSVPQPTQQPLEPSMFPPQRGNDELPF